MSLVQSSFFKKSAEQAFKKFDKDNSGTISTHELTVAMCHLHFKVAKNSPGLTELPTEDLVMETLDKYDMDKSGTLSQEEFTEFAVKWFEKNSSAFFGRLVLSSLISMVVLPGAASLLHSKAPAANRIPKIVFKVVFGVVFKIVATSIPSKTEY